jgi:hypothetical protein
MRARYFINGAELTPEQQLAYLRRLKQDEWEAAERARLPGRPFSRESQRLRREAEALTSKLVELVGWSGTAQLDDWLDYATFKRIEILYETPGPNAA